MRLKTGKEGRKRHVGEKYKAEESLNGGKRRQRDIINEK